MSECVTKTGSNRDHSQLAPNEIKSDTEGFSTLTRLSPEEAEYNDSSVQAQSTVANKDINTSKKRKRKTKKRQNRRRGGITPISLKVKPLDKGYRARKMAESVSRCLRTKPERSSAIALHVLETEHHVDFDNPEILSKYWPIYRDRINAEQWFISHQPEACNLKGKTTHPA